MNESFKPAKYKQKLIGIFYQISSSDKWSSEELHKILKNNLKSKGQFFSKDELVMGYEFLINEGELEKDVMLERRIRLKPVRSQSGVTVVTVMTKPYDCPGKCIYCPQEEGLPKSYLSKEPGAQRALTNKFDPYLQTYNRLQALQNTGHNIDKIEVIILGGTWSFYPKDYQLWFVTRIFQALNDFPNENRFDCEDDLSWQDLIKEQEINETANSRCVGMSIETRPDYVTQEELIDLRKIGVTKVQIGLQSLDNSILKHNRRGHTVQQSKEAFRLLLQSGFKIQAHWMPNLYKSDVKMDTDDYERLWNKDFRPDELKIYPTSLIRGTYLYDLYQEGKYQPYRDEQLKSMLKNIMVKTPRYCRLTRVVRDIPSEYIEEGSRVSNMRQIVESELEKEGNPCECIRCREIKGRKVKFEDLEYEEIRYGTSIGTEIFMSYRTKDDKLVGFLRLSLPKEKSFIDELGKNSVIREVHVYGEVTGLSKKGKSQHLGIGSSLVEKAKQIANKEGYDAISVISSVGTREYYRKLGFELGELYMRCDL